MEYPLTYFEAGFAHLYAANLQDLEVDALKGLPWRVAAELAQKMAVSAEVLADWIDAAPARAGGEALSSWAMDPTQSFLLLFIARLVGQVEVTLQPADISNEGSPAAWVGRWLQSPNDALQGRTPSEFLCTHTRRELLVDLISRPREPEPPGNAEGRLGTPCAQGARAGLSDAAVGHVVAVDTPLLGPALLVPTDFPRGIEGAVPGTQAKLLCRRMGSRFVVGPTDYERAERYAACRDLVAALVEYVKRKRQDLPGMDRPTLLRKVRDRVAAKGWDYSPAELDWVMAKVDARWSASV